jgi:hypothetical protein
LVRHSDRAERDRPAFPKPAPTSGHSFWVHLNNHKATTPILEARKGELRMLKKFAVVLVVVTMSAGAANAMMAHHKHMAMAACADGAAAKATCVCKAMSGPAKATCKAGEWCHTFSGTCGK